ncbi:MAG: UDP-N-acetylmuramoyl-tripeptide--D-alanyl-D-alanine ligase, partial [Verrucomicrobiia bacterium]
MKMHETLPLTDIVSLTGGVLVQGSEKETFSEIGIDSRRVVERQLFVAVRGAHFDGHWFIDEAHLGGAMGDMIEPDVIIFELPALPPEFVLIRVKNTLAALQSIAREYRKRLPMRTVAVTGSNGKTSAKEFIAAALGQKFKVVKNKANLNNHIGVPLSLLQATPEHEVGVFEAGMNHRGEIAPLSGMIQPDIAVITNIGVAHIEHLGSREAIFEEKAEILSSLHPEGTLVYDAEDDFAERLAQLPASRKVGVGFERGDIRAENIKNLDEGVAFTLILPGGQVDVSLKTPGPHMIRNALLAAGVADVMDVEVEQIGAGLSQAKLPKGRLQVIRHEGITILDDSYNANPDSMKAALKTLLGMTTEGRRIAVLGEMRELG